MLFCWQGQSPGTGLVLDKMPETSSPVKLHLFPVPTTLPGRSSQTHGEGGDGGAGGKQGQVQKYQAPEPTSTCSQIREPENPDTSSASTASCEGLSDMVPGRPVMRPLMRRQMPQGGEGRDRLGTQGQGPRKSTPSNVT